MESSITTSKIKTYDQFDYFDMLPKPVRDEINNCNFGLRFGNIKLLYLKYQNGASEEELIRLIKHRDEYMILTNSLSSLSDYLKKTT